LPEQIIENATANPDRMEGGIGAANRKRRIAELEAELFELETDEKSLITQAFDAGMEAHRRVHASGFALLGLEVVKPNGGDRARANVATLQIQVRPRVHRFTRGPPTPTCHRMRCKANPD
jgi:hypothetical protein